MAFVGTSVSGKSSLVKLLVVLYRPTEGRILYNDLDVANLDLASLRYKIGFVTQETQLFARTIRENLLFVKPDANDKELLTVLKHAAWDSLLERASQGLNTVIGKGGVKVSVGEK